VKYQKIYNVEKKLRAENMTPEDFIIERRKHVEPLLEDIKKWLDKKVINLRPESKLGKAV